MAPTQPTSPSFLPLLLLGLLACADAVEPAPGRLLAGGGDGERPAFHDLGTLAHGDTAEHTFTLENTGSEPVRILNVRSACACSTPGLGYRAADGTWVSGNPRNRSGPALVLPPGLTAELTLRVDTRSIRTLNTDKLVLVRVQSDAPTTPFLTFELHLIVERLFQATPDPLDLGTVPTGGGGSARSELARATRDGQARLLRILSTTPPFEATLESWDSFGTPIWGLTAAVPGGLDLGPVFGEVVLATTDRGGTDEGQPFTLPLRVQVVTDWIASPAQLLLRPTRASDDAAVTQAAALEARTTILFLLPGARQSAPRWELEGAVPGTIEVSLLPSGPLGTPPSEKSASWTLSLRAAPGDLPPRAAGTLHLHAAGEDLPDLAIPWRAP